MIEKIDTEKLVSGVRKNCYYGYEKLPIILIIQNENQFNIYWKN